MGLFSLLVSVGAGFAGGFLLSTARSAPNNSLQDEIEMLKRGKRNLESTLEEKNSEVEKLKKQIRRMRAECEVAEDASDESESKLSEFKKINARLNEELSAVRRELSEITRLYEEKVARLRELGED